MEVVLILVYTAIYFAGYYGGHVVNLAVRRVWIKNLRLAGLTLVAVTAAAVALWIEIQIPPEADAYAKGYLQGKLAIGPALMVGIVVGIRMWLENRKLGKPRKFGD
jgi:hypothetical protein